MAKYETLNSNSETKITIARLAKKFDMSLVDFLDAMAKYFEITGLNPKDQVVLSPAEELKKLRDTLVSFMRKQENDFIKPTFGKMDTLIARFVKYIEEEAPKNAYTEGQSKFKNVVTSSKIATGDNKETQENENINGGLNSEQYKILLEKHEVLELKYSTTKKYFEKVLSHVQEKSTGLNKKPVVELPMGDINEYKAYLKKL